MKMPPPPTPVHTLPTTNVSKETAVAVMVVPMQIIMVEQNMQRRGLNTWDNLPIKGAIDDMAIK